MPENDEHWINQLSLRRKKGSHHVTNILLGSLIFILILERGKGGENVGERNINMREKQRLVASPKNPNLGPNPQPRHMPQPGTEPVTLGLQDTQSTEPHLPGWNVLFLFLSFFNICYWLCYYSCPIFFSPLFPSSLYPYLPPALPPI